MGGKPEATLKLWWFKMPQSLDQTPTQSSTCAGKGPVQRCTAVVVLLRALRTAPETVPRALEKRGSSGVSRMVGKAVQLRVRVRDSSP